MNSTVAALPQSVRYARWAVFIMFTVNGWANAHWVARIPDAKAILGLSEGTLGIALFSVAFGALIAQVLSGWLISKYGSRRVTLGFALFLCAAIALLGFSWNLPTLMLGLALHGAGVGGMDVAMNVQATEVERGYGRPIMTAFHGMWSVGSLIGASLGGLLAGVPLSIKTHLFGVGVVSALIVLVTARALINDDHTVHAGGGASFALPKGALIGMGLMAFCVLCAEGAVADWSTLYMRDTLGQPPQSATLAFAFFSGTMAIGRFLGDGLTQKLGQATVLRGSGALIIIGIMVAIASSTPVPVVIGFMLVGAGLCCVFPLILSMAARIPGVSPGVSIAAMATAGYSGFLIGPPTIGLAAELFTLRWALTIIGVFGVLVLTLAWKQTSQRQ